MTPVTRMISRVVCLLTIFLTLTGCASNKPPAAPTVKVSLDHFTGGPLSGPATKPADLSDDSAALWVDVRVLALPASYASTMAPIGPRVQLITASRGGMPILAAGQMTRGILWADTNIAEIESRLTTGDKNTAQLIGSYQLAVPRSVSALISVADNLTPGGEQRQVQLFLHQPETNPPGLELAIAVSDDLVALSDSSDETAAKAPEFVRELAILRKLPIQDSVSAAVLIPFRFSDNLHHSMLVLINASQGKSSTEKTAALAISAADLKRSADAAKSQPSVSTLTIAETPGFDAALAAIRKPATRRPSLAYLAGQTGAAVCEDVSLIATDESLDQLATEIFKQLEGVKPPHSAESLGWALDIATMRYLGQLQSTNKLPDDLLSVLLRHTGQVGANSGSIDDIIKAVGNRKDLLARITADNFVYLEDNSPSARVRAYDWLNARGEAPAGYDPLDPPRQRQQALQQSYDAMAAKSAQQGGRP